MVAQAKNQPPKRGPGRPKGSTGPHRPRTMRHDQGVIEAHEMLKMKAFMGRVGCSYAHVRSMIDRGLKVRKNGRYRLILGSDYHEFLSNLPTIEPRPKPAPEPPVAPEAPAAAD
jgi:hypothetical protein